MGKGDKKSKKGKISMGTFGVSRPKRTGATTAAATPAAPQAAPAKAAPKK